MRNRVRKRAEEEKGSSKMIRPWKERFKTGNFRKQMGPHLLTINLSPNHLIIISLSKVAIRADGVESIIVISRWQSLGYLYYAVRGHDRSYCHVMPHEKMYKFVSTRHVVIVSLAINLELLWKFTNEGEGLEANVQRKNNVVRSSTTMGLTLVDEVKHQDMVEVVIGLDF